MADEVSIFAIINLMSDWKMRRRAGKERNMKKKKKILHQICFIKEKIFFSSLSKMIKLKIISNVVAK